MLSVSTSQTLALRYTFQHRPDVEPLWSPSLFLFPLVTGNKLVHKQFPSKDNPKEDVILHPSNRCEQSTDLSCHLLCSPRGQKLCKNVRDLEHVDVSHCVALSDPAVRAISFYCTGLVTLRMSGCPKVHTQQTLSSAAFTCSLLVPLSLHAMFVAFFFFFSR